jgi:hypothetical protein
MADGVAKKMKKMDQMISQVPLWMTHGLIILGVKSDLAKARRWFLEMTRISAMTKALKKMTKANFVTAGAYLLRLKRQMISSHECAQRLCPSFC